MNQWASPAITHPPNDIVQTDRRQILRYPEYVHAVQSTNRKSRRGHCLRFRGDQRSQGQKVHVCDTLLEPGAWWIVTDNGEDVLRGSDVVAASSVS